MRKYHKIDVYIYQCVNEIVEFGDSRRCDTQHLGVRWLKNLLGGGGYKVFALVVNFIRMFHFQFVLDMCCYI